MSNLKRWAKFYYKFSPIFQDKSFNQPGNQNLLVINSRLLVAYCIKMKKQAKYSKQKVKAILQSHCKQGNYWIKYTQRLLQVSQEKSKVQINNEISIEQALTRQNFEQLLSKLYHNKINEQQFTSLCQKLQFLLPKGAITELDFYVLDLSFNSIDQLVEISSIKLQAALESIGPYSLAFLQGSLKKQINANSFQLISLLNRIKDTVNLSPQLQMLYLILEGKQNIQQLFINQKQKNYQCVKKQAFGFMLWLLHMNELGEFTYKFIRQNYLFSRYCKDSIQMTCNIIQAISLNDSLKFSQLIMLNEVVFKLQDIQQQEQFYQHVRHNIKIERKLKYLKDKISEYLGRFEQKSMDNACIGQLDKYQIDFQSSLSVNMIRKSINRLVDQPHFSIILQKENYHQLLNLSLKIRQRTLYEKIKLKLKLNLQRKPGLLLTLLNIKSKQITIQPNLNINSIYQLKRIKKILLEHSDSQNQTLQKIFSSEDILLLTQLKSKLIKGYKQLRQHQIDHRFSRIFITFKL